MKRITFNPSLITKKLLNALDERPRDVLEKRFGLVSGSPRTLESIGREYNITRERVRQIEAFALNKARKSEEFSALSDVFGELKSCIDEKGGVVHEGSFLGSDEIKKGKFKPHVYFLLVAGNEFERHKENDDFHCTWTTNPKRADSVKAVLKELHSDVGSETLIPEDEIISSFVKKLGSVVREDIEQEILRLLLGISRVVGPNILGEWGRIASPFIKPRGMRDYAFLVIREHGSPMHFSEVASAIERVFKRPAHVQTVHNELIKDERFVLVGRGLYALKVWGYEGGVVRNVIERVLSSNGPLPKDDIIKRVLKERYVKENTILVNLQNRNYFKRDKRGHYTLI